MFWHNYKYAFKTLIKSKEMVFFSFSFPFILALLFNMAFAKLHDYDTFDPLNVAVVNDEAYQKDIAFSQAFKGLSEGDERVFNTQYVEKEKAEELLENGDVEGYVFIEDNEAKVKIKENGTMTTVLVLAVEQISQSVDAVNDIAMDEIQRADGAVDIPAIYAQVAAKISEAQPNIKDDSRVMNIVAIEFYTLIAMAIMQGAMVSSDMINRCLPNISNRGKRVAIAPTRKSIILLSSLLAGYTMLFICVVLLILFIRFVLGIELGDNLGLILVHSAIGSLAATAMGMWLSIILKTNDAAKNVIIMTITMVGCMFAGMFGGQKVFFDELLPIVNKISPVGMITDGFYSLYYYDDLNRFIVNVVGLLIIAGIFFALSIRGLRRQRYDSI